MAQTSSRLGFAIRHSRRGRPKPSNATTPCWNNPPWRHNLNQMASAIPGRFSHGDAPVLSEVCQLLIFKTGRPTALSCLLGRRPRRPTARAV
jgi:hypothetical protein